jgi:hypothetical protein
MKLNKTIFNISKSKEGFFNLKGDIIDIDLFKNGVIFNLVHQTGEGIFDFELKKGEFKHRVYFGYFKSPIRSIEYYFQNHYSYFHIPNNIDEYMMKGKKHLLKLK